MPKFEVNYSEGKFWLIGNDASGEYESEITSWDFANKLSNGFRWGLKYKTDKQRKWRISSAVTLKIEPLISLATIHLRDGKSVCILTPDIEVNFFTR
jgi:hypothetical protein